METFADYILAEKSFTKKVEIMYYLKKKINIYFDKSVVLKTQIAKLFIEEAHLDVDENLVITACLLCSCKKNIDPADFGKVKTYAKEGADFLRSLGFSNRFCKICEEVNRYSDSHPREKESDILELVDQFGGMILDRPERIAFKIDEALVMLEHRNLRGKGNLYLSQFIDFVRKEEEIPV